MPNGDLVAGIYSVFKEDDHPQPVQAQHETVPGSVAPLHRRGQELVLRLPPSPRDPWGQEGFNEPVIVRLSQGPDHEGAGSSA